MFFILFFATAASACRRMLAESVSSLDIEAPRMLQQRATHFTAGEWGANGVLKLEADGSPCASGTGGDAATDGGFAASWDTPREGCYRVDAHAAGADCGFGGRVTLTIDWCAGRTDTVQYTQTAGWTALGVYPFYPGQYSGIMQEEGAVDAFRVVAVPSCRVQEPPVFGSLTLNTDADAMPADLASQLAQEVADIGEVLTASFRAYVEPTRRLTASQMNHVIIDFDISSAGDSSMPTDAQINQAAEKVCSLLQTTECATEVSFTLDESGEVVKTRKKQKNGPKEVRGPMGLMVLPVAAIALFGVCAALGKKYQKSRSESKSPDQDETKAEKEEGKPVAEGDAGNWWDAFQDVFWDAEEKKPEEKKPQQEDDNASTACDTVSLPDSLPSTDQNVADRV